MAVNSNIVKTLMEREWIRIVGYREVPGRPAMFATTKAFLDELPPLAELREMEPQVLADDPDEAPVPAHLHADEAQEGEPKEQTSFRSLLVELDAMEEGLKTDFDDLRQADDAVEAPEDKV